MTHSPRGEIVEVVGALGIVAGLALVASDVVWLAATCTVAVPVLTIATWERNRRRLYGCAAVVAALGMRPLRLPGVVRKWRPRGRHQTQRGRRGLDRHHQRAERHEDRAHGPTSRVPRLTQQR